MEIEIAEQLKVKLEHEIHKKLVIFEQITGLIVESVDLMRVHSMGGSSDLVNTKLKVEMK
jgi:hypothetical protein